jgi:transposase-like protein
MAEDAVVLISKDNKGRTKLEYTQADEKRFLLWEKRSGKLLETLFDQNGAILIQRLTALNEDLINKKISEISKMTNSSVAEASFSEIKFNKPCPKCNADSLERYVDAFASKGDVPVMPLYYCKSCKSKSYYLTDSYLEYLIENNKSLLSESELSELGNNGNAFVSEVREYIIRMFASQKVICIR